ncbi:MAG TPA: LSM domain-containing protein [archaeon]|nr:LSM domain-containing protein [archaeon]HUW68155.1 LSM domain-containing protein [Candidatus Nanoarchaeia archaeon]
MFPTKKLQSMVGQKIQVEMKGGQHILEGILESSDEYLNMHLNNTVEIIDGEKSISLGSVVLRGNNVIIINPVDN